MVQAAAFAVAFAVIQVEKRDNNPRAATFYAAINAPQMLPLVHMQTIDSHAYGMAKTTGAYLADAGLSLATCAAFAVRPVGSRSRRQTSTRPLISVA